MNKLQSYSVNEQEPVWLQEKRKKAFEQFSELSMPNFVYGLNIDLDISLDLDQIEISKQKVTLPTIQGTTNDIVIRSLQEFITKNEDIAKKALFSLVPAQDKFTAFHNAFVENIAVVHVPAGVVVETPIELTSVAEGTSFEHLLVIAEKNSSITLVENSSSKKEGYRSKIVEVFADDNALVNYGNVQLLDHNTFNFTIKRGSALKDATINWMDCCFGSSITLSEVTTVLNGSGARTHNQGVFLGSGKQQYDLVCNSIHRAPNTFSDIFTKGALTGASKCLYRGLVKIHDNAADSNGYQKQDTLLLSKDAVANSIPNLEIDNNNVKCSHGATIGKIDPEKLFYLKSRGLTEQEATKLYVRGFFEQLLQNIKIPHLQESMHELIDQHLK